MDIVIGLLLCLILLLMRGSFKVMAFSKHVASNVGEILLQFPFHAGILGIMAGSGLIQFISGLIVSISMPPAFGDLPFLSAGPVNVFVPSGGGQFAVQGPIMPSAGAGLGFAPALPIMAEAYCGQWMNMNQPFRALPMLAIAGLKMRGILGCTTIMLLASGIVVAGTVPLVSL